MSARGLSLSLLVLWIAGCAGSPARLSALEEWQSLETRGVRIIADVSPEDLDALAQDLSGFHAAFSSLVGGEISATGPTTIAVIRDRGLAQQLGLGQGAAGFAFTTLDGAFACVLWDPSRTETRITLFHEYTHLLLWRH